MSGVFACEEGVEPLLLHLLTKGLIRIEIAYEKRDASAGHIVGHPKIDPSGGRTRTPSRILGARGASVRETGNPHYRVSLVAGGFID